MCSSQINVKNCTFRSCGRKNSSETDTQILGGEEREREREQLSLCVWPSLKCPCLIRAMQPLMDHHPLFPFSLRSFCSLLSLPLLLCIEWLWCFDIQTLYHPSGIQLHFHILPLSSRCRQGLSILNTLVTCKDSELGFPIHSCLFFNSSADHRRCSDHSLFNTSFLLASLVFSQSQHTLTSRYSLRTHLRSRDKQIRLHITPSVNCLWLSYSQCNSIFFIFFDLSLISLFAH